MDNGEDQGGDAARDQLMRELEVTEEELLLREKKLALLDEELSQYRYRLEALGQEASIRNGDALSITAREGLRAQLEEKIHMRNRSRVEIAGDVERARERKESIELELRELDSHEP